MTTATAALIPSQLVHRRWLGRSGVLHPNCETTGSLSAALVHTMGLRLGIAPRTLAATDSLQVETSQQRHIPGLTHFSRAASFGHTLSNNGNPARVNCGAHGASASEAAVSPGARN
jgi:hypothetical protein